jgi:hypothetical protein
MNKEININNKEYYFIITEKERSDMSLYFIMLVVI